MFVKKRPDSTAISENVVKPRTDIEVEDTTADWYECPYCGKLEWTTKDWQDHIDRNHADLRKKRRESSKYTNPCGKTFVSLVTAREHLERHKDVKDGWYFVAGEGYRSDGLARVDVASDKVTLYYTLNKGYFKYEAYAVVCQEQTVCDFVFNHDLRPLDSADVKDRLRGSILKLLNSDIRLAESIGLDVGYGHGGGGE